jgi:hypothetical protein
MPDLPSEQTLRPLNCVSIIGSSNVGLRIDYLPSNAIPQDSGVET